MPVKIMETSDFIRPWDRLPKESLKAYAAFKSFIGSEGEHGIRNLTALAAKLGCSPPNLSLWTTKHKWNERSIAYDAWRAQKDEENRDEAIRDSVRKVARDWAEHRSQFLKRFMRSHMLILNKVEQMLEYPVTYVEEEIVETYDDGRTKVIAHVHPAKWRARDMALISRNLVLSLKEVMEMIEGPATAAAAGDDDALDPDEAAAAIRAIADMRARKANIPIPTKQG